MFKSFLKIALRYLWRKKTYSILNFVCLTFGLTCSVIAILYILHFIGHDNFQKNCNRLYSVDAYVTFFNGDRFPKEYLSASLTDVLRANAPEIEEMARITSRDCSFISGDKTFSGTGFYADSNFFDLFTFPLVNNGKPHVLADLSSIAISEKMAAKFFESSDCIGKTLILKDGNKNEAFIISGVFKEPPTKSLMQFDFVIPFTRFLSANSWALETGATADETWILLKNNVDRKLVENKIKNLIMHQETTLNQELFLFPLSEHILYRYVSGKRTWTGMQNIVIAGTIGFAILLIACFNFINLAIALNLRRYREAGIKKVSGSGKSAIVFQFLGETLIITLVSLLTALMLVRVLLTGFNMMFHYDIHLRLTDVRLIGIIISLTLFTSLLSGLLPALYLASSSPISVLKGKILTSHSYSTLRQSLIVFQLTIPVVLIICMIFIKTQASYMANYDSGVDKDKVIVLENQASIQKHAESVKAELLSYPGIDAVSFTNCIPTRGARISNDVNWEGKDATEKLDFWCVDSDFDYDKTVRVKMIEGRFFNPSFSTDSDAYIINDIAAGVMKFKSPVGSSITFEGQKGTIIGICKDFHSVDLRGPLVPTIMRIKSGDRPIMLVKYSSGSFPSIINEIREIYKRYGAEDPFNATLFRDLRPYSDLSLPAQLAGLAFIIATLLACMGLFGLASFTSENRTKEIGIRKINGATSFSMMRLLLTNYTKWLAIAIFIALPIAFMLGKRFLGEFYFHCPVPVWAFFTGPFIASIVALLTVSMLTWNIANRNPAKSLRYE